MRVHVRVPATSANLGPGFDTLGLALALRNEVTAAEAEGVSVRIEGEGAARLARGGDNVVARGVRLAFEAAGRRFPGCALDCLNRVPTARGLGSSAAAWVGGLVAGNALLGSPLPREALLALAARAEGHPDNVAAALLGGLTVACADGEGVTAVALPVPPALRWVALIPGVTSATAEARAVLPRTVPREDAVFNVQRVALLLASLQAGRTDALARALEDRLHQPYRLKLFPWMPDVAAAARAAGALGCVLSGAGPALLAVTTGDAGDLGRAMEAALRAAGIAGAAHALAVDTEGAVVRVLGGAA
ncbi:MAG: homoserine kinase [Candidatus Rokubacteria bacterium RIFCSPLOWO2_12_FULL_73_47]|nr:MAG: homoserine kinase [Candidatus Rokubacteria bacterium RIFCSPLOWO2_12_FULL_73_47]